MSTNIIIRTGGNGENLWSQGDTGNGMVPERTKDAKGKKAGADRGLRKKVTHSVRILLVRPMVPGNVGSVARVMKNLGFRSLGIVSDLDPRDEPEAFWMAHGAQDVLEAASLYADLDEALGSVDLVIGTTSRRGTRWREALEPEGLVDLLTAGWDWRPTALLFGPEDRGLSVKELSLCRWVARIPTREECPSMNLSHAVGLICYILARGNNKVPECGRSGAVPPGETQRLVDEAGVLLKKMNFLTGDAARNQTAMRHLQRLIVRASPNKAELAWLWALLRHVKRQTR